MLGVSCESGPTWETVFAGIAVVLSVVSILSQIVLWRRSGPVVKVTVNMGFIASPATGEVSDKLVQVTAYNTGRSPVTVTGWAFELPSGDGIVLIEQWPGSSPLPCRLEPGSHGFWLIPAQLVMVECKKRSINPGDLRALVTANGRKVYARRRGVGAR